MERMLLPSQAYCNKQQLPLCFALTHSFVSETLPVCFTNVCVCFFVFVCVCPPGASSTRATTALAVEQEHTKSVWKSSPSVKSVGVPSNLRAERLIQVDF